MVEKKVQEQELHKIIKSLIIIIQPFIPHISEEMWSVVGGEGFCANTNWPKTKKFFNKEAIKMPIQVNGKTRSLVDVDFDEDKDQVLERVMGDSKIIKYTQNKEILKTIYIKNKIVNLVVQ